MVQSWVLTADRCDDPGTSAHSLTLVVCAGGPLVLFHLCRSLDLSITERFQEKKKRTDLGSVYPSVSHLLDFGRPFVSLQRTTISL